jgi:hypothetical protein
MKINRGFMDKQSIVLMVVGWMMVMALGPAYAGEIPSRQAYTAHQPTQVKGDRAHPWLLYVSVGAGVSGMIGLGLLTYCSRKKAEASRQHRQGAILNGLSNLQNDMSNFLGLLGQVRTDLNRQQEALRGAHGRNCCHRY